MATPRFRHCRPPPRQVWSVRPWSASSSPTSTKRACVCRKSSLSTPPLRNRRGRQSLDGNCLKQPVPPSTDAVGRRAGSRPLSGAHLGGLGWPAPQQPDRAGVLRAHLQPSRSGSGVADLPRAATWRPGPPSSSPSPLWRHLHEGSEAMGGVLPWPIASPIRPMCGCRRRRADPSPSWPAGGYGPSRMKTGISTAAPPPPLHGQPAAQWRTDKVSGGAIGGSHLPARPASECLTSRSPAMLGSRGKPHRQTSHVGRVAEAASRARGIDHTV